MTEDSKYSMNDTAKVLAGLIGALVCTHIALLVTLFIIGFIIKKFIDGKIVSNSAPPTVSETRQSDEKQTTQNHEVQPTQPPLPLPPDGRENRAASPPGGHVTHSHFPATYELIGSFQRAAESNETNEAPADTSEYAEVIRHRE